MKNRTNNFVSVLLLIVYGTLTIVAVPLHHHDNSIFSTGTGHHEFVQHDDALNCHHRIADVHDECTICSIVSHSSFSKVIAVIPEVKPVSQEYFVSSSAIVLQETHSSHAHRGPPDRSIPLV